MFIRNLILVMALFILVAFQVSFTPVFTNSFPDLLLVVISVLCWTDRKTEALWAAFFGGVFYDLLTVYPVGGRSLLLIFVVLVLSSIHHRTDNLFSRFLSVFLLALGWRLYPSVLAEFHWAGLLWGRVAFLALLDAATAVVLYPLLGRLFGHILAKEELQLSFRDKLG